MKKVSVIIVTHNSEKYLDKGISLLFSKCNLIIVDSGSDNTNYLLQYSENARLIFCENIGFSAANNIGYKHIGDSEYVLFLNPDAFIEHDQLCKMHQHMNNNPAIGILTAPLRGYNFTTNTETGIYDSVGVFRKWYGKWFDKYQGASISSIKLPSLPYEITAACGALMLCRVSFLNKVLLNQREVFDERFFMYKEDIELSLRIRRKGYKVVLHPDVIAYHGRGWSRNRSKMPLIARIISARNEILIDKKIRSPYIIYTFLKYLYVRFLESSFLPGN